MELTSSAFAPGGKIPSKYTCDGERSLSPPLTITNVPAGTKSLAITMDDPDIPDVKKKEFGIEVYDHWVLYNLTPPPAGGLTELEEGTILGQRGVNGRGETGYMGPCPPPQFEPKEHRYFFRAYALRDTLPFDHPPTKAELLQAVEPLAIETAELIGRYERAKVE